MSADDDYQYTQTMRRRLVDAFLKDGELPNDPKDAKIILSALDGMDKQSLGRQRLQVDDSRNKNEQALAEAMWSQINAATGNPFARDPGENPIPQGSDQLPEVNHPPGVMEQGIPDNNYEQFIAEYERNHPEEKN